MEFKKRLVKEREILESWDQIKKHEKSLSEILLMYREAVPKDYVLFYQCINMVLDYTKFYEEEIIKPSKKINKQPILDSTRELLKSIPKELFDKIANELQFYIQADNEEASISKRLEAIEKIRRICWKRIYDERGDIEKLSNKFPLEKLGEKEFVLLFKCISMVALEISMKDQEVGILENLKFE